MVSMNNPLQVMFVTAAMVALTLALAACQDIQSRLPAGSACAKAEADYLIALATEKSPAFIERERLNMVEACPDPKEPADPST